MGGRAAALEPLLLADPHPPRTVAPASEAAPAKNDRRSILLVMEPPCEGDPLRRDECSDNNGRCPETRSTLEPFRTTPSRASARVAGADRRLRFGRSRDLPAAPAAA